MSYMLPFVMLGVWLDIAFWWLPAGSFWPHSGGGVL